MNLFEQIKYELLNESGNTPAQRVNEYNSQQKKEWQKVIDALEFEFNKIIQDLGLKGGPLNKTNGLMQAPSGRTKKKEDYRVKSHIFQVTEQWLNNVLIAHGLDDCKVEELQGKEASKFSGTFTTFKISTFNDAEIFIVITKSTKAGKKQLTPKAFGIEDKLYNYKEIYEKVNKNIDIVVKDEEVKDYLKYLLKSATFAPITSSSNIIKVLADDYEGTVPIKDIPTISNDFGEIIGAIVVARKEKEEIFFPKSATEPLIDYEVGSFRYSAKSLSGASPTLTSIAKKYDKFVENEMEGSVEDKKKIIEIFKYLNSSSMNGSQTTLAITKAIYPEAWEAFLGFMEIQDADPNNKKLLLNINNKMKEYYDMEVLKEKIEEYWNVVEKKSGYKKTNSKRKDIEDYNENDSNSYGYITNPLGYALAKYLNNVDESVKNSLKKIIRDHKDVKQINYQWKNGFQFKITSFLDDDFEIEFVGGGSIDSPNHQKLRFKIIV